MSENSLSPDQTVVLELLRAADDGSGTFPTTEHISRRTGRDELLVERVLDDLVRLRLIERAGPFAEYDYPLVTSVRA